MRARVGFWGSNAPTMSTAFNPDAALQAHPNAGGVDDAGARTATTATATIAISIATAAITTILTAATIAPATPAATITAIAALRERRGGRRAGDQRGHADEAEAIDAGQDHGREQARHQALTTSLFVSHAIPFGWVADGGRKLSQGQIKMGHPVAAERSGTVTMASPPSERAVRSQRWIARTSVAARTARRTCVKLTRQRGCAALRHP